MGTGAVGRVAAETASLSPDWSQLPLDPLVVVMVELETPDLVRSGAVCSSWHTSYATVRRLRIESPRLFYTRTEDADPDVATIYNPARGTSFTVRLPDLHGRSLHGSAHGWLMVADDVANLHLVNPVTRAQLALPPITALYHTEAAAPDKQGNPRYSVRDDEPESYAAHDLRLLMYLRAVPSCSPSAGSQCVVLLLHHPDGELSFARLGDKDWTWITWIGDEEDEDRYFDEMWFSYGYCDAVYNKDGLFYVLRCGGDIITLDLNGDSPVMKKMLAIKRNDTPTSIYLIMAPWGDLLQVWRTTDPPDIDSEDLCLALHTVEIELYKVDIESKQLVRMESLEDYALFLGLNSSMILSTKDFPMLKSDCAYLTHDDSMDIWLRTNGPKEIGVWNFRSGTLENVDDNVHSWQNWPVPIWFTPSLS
ncbi:hypothetical protein HU200_033370 [Digitaria exilis]|uniref:KIB1-4 beta-propeller domain-containing protein n=1 Tax=Digitaria exilis TaxID=1010633 RepID=A0A835BLX6_9POAL|nr:hypothetical protein HU200_033370 [Digitaria exilis]